MSFKYEMIYGIYFLLYIILFVVITFKVFKNPSCRAKMSRKSLILILAIISVFPLIYYFRLGGEATFNYIVGVSPACYGIMFDAGSTGSRMHVFKFNVSKTDPLLILDDSLFISAKPGLSSYSNNPSMASESLKPMLEKAKSYIPKNFWSSTPVALKATAGLRMLPEMTSSLILYEVEQLLRQYPFKLMKDGVSILEGDDEGLFSWFTVNYLNGSLRNLSETNGVLDLGGGSTQITFYPQDVPSSKEYLVNVELLSSSYELYTHSYLGLGMMSARFKILGGNENISEELQSQKLISPCLPPSYRGDWGYRGFNHEVESSNATDRFTLCKQKSKEMIIHYNIKKPSSRKLFAISYFFDVAMDEKLISDSKVGAEVTVDTFHTLAQNACKSSNISTPFRCVDLCYISSLLSDGYGLDAKQPLVLKKEIKDFEIAWALGAMFEVFNKFKVKKTN